MKKKLLSLFTILTLVVAHADAQTYFTNPFGGSYFQPKANLHVGSFFTNKDILVDIGVGFDEIGYDFSITLNGSFRPYLKTILFEESDHFYIQARERILQFSLDFEKRFYFLEYGSDSRSGKIGIYGLLKVGYFFGIHKGFSGTQNEAFALNPGGGLSWQMNDVARLSAGYLYYNQKVYEHNQPHNIYISFAFILGGDNAQQ